MLSGLLVIFFMGCSPMEMGELCEESSDCQDGGTCLKGVCSGYGCESDADCTNNYRCATILESQVCSLDCESDDDCLGEQSCTAVTPDADGALEAKNHCL